MEEAFISSLEKWYNENGRNFFWRDEELTSFQILITELFLKRTRAKNVEKNIENLIEELKSPEDAVDIDEDVLKEQIRPLGLYNRREKQIKEISHILIDEYEGEVPKTKEKLRKLPGVGPYVSDAVLVLAHNKRKIPVDTNVARVGNKYFDITPAKDLRNDNKLEEKFLEIAPQGNLDWFVYALIDLGQTLREENGQPLECL